ncbi:S41 family peptidase [Thermocatellispora tengchongensis]|uniref:S41 family peptidase n=1 Tax=Thermocatellispora tengchongensis TaxID=1073253 RepID=UPI00362F3332
MVVFAAEDDLWMVPAAGGWAFRLTAGVAEAGYPRFSPKGDRIAFAGREEGPEEVYVMPADGGAAQRVTFHGARSTVTAWHGDDTIVYASDAGQPFDGHRRLHRVTPGAEGPPERLPYGPANTISHGPGGAVVLGRNTADPARWKRYRGGTVGDLWIDRNGNGEFQRLIALPGNLASPCWAGDRIYFLSDHEGVGNVYSCAADGSGLRRHTDHADYYARNLSGDGTRLVYHAGGELYVLDPDEGEARRLDVRLRSSHTQRNRRFVPASRYLDSATLNPDGSGLAITTRGKAYSFANWEGPVRQHGEPDGVRYRLLTWLNDGARLVAAASDDGDREVLVVLTADGTAEPRRLDHLDTGRAIELEVSPAADKIALTNHRNELLLVDLTGEEATATVAESGRYGRVEEPAWSPDGRWLAYTCPDSANTSAIKLYDTAKGETFRATRPVLRDSSPAFDPDGRYLYFIGQRVFNPVHDSSSSTWASRSAAARTPSRCAPTSATRSCPSPSRSPRRTTRKRTRKKKRKRARRPRKRTTRPCASTPTAWSAGSSRSRCPSGATTASPRSRARRCSPPTRWSAAARTASSPTRARCTPTTSRS